MQGREATFNSPDFVNGRYRSYDRNFDAAALAKAAGRKHQFPKPPRRLRELARWDWVLPHCHEKDGWLDRVRAVMVGLPSDTKWLIHGCALQRPSPLSEPRARSLEPAVGVRRRSPLSPPAA